MDTNGFGGASVTEFEAEVSQEAPWEPNTGCDAQDPRGCRRKPALKAASASHVPIAEKTVCGKTLRQLADENASALQQDRRRRERRR